MNIRSISKRLAVVLVIGFSLMAICWFTNRPKLLFPNVVKVKLSNTESEWDHVSFQIWNLTSTPVTLTAEPHCGCTAIDWKEGAINGWSSREISVTIDKKLFKNRRQSDIMFYTSEPSIRYLNVHLELAR